jgi:hypothetical protein
MSKNIDVSIVYYGKPYQTIVSILSLLKYSENNIDTVFITVEKKQPFDQYAGIHIVLDALKDKVKIKTYYPKFFYSLGPLDDLEIKNNSDLRWSIPYQYALEKSDKPFVFIMHNDMLFHDNMIGQMLKNYAESKNKYAGLGSIGQCWSCPAGPTFAKKCNGFLQHKTTFTQTEALELHHIQKTPRKKLDIEIIESGRYFPLPECRLNEYACMIDTAVYRQNTLPEGSKRCFGGVWNGADLGTTWFYQMVNDGYQFKHLSLEQYATHSPFNSVGQGIQAYSKADNYKLSEQNALDHLIKNYNYSTSIDTSTRIKILTDTVKRKGWTVMARTYGFLKRLIGK